MYKLYIGNETHISFNRAKGTVKSLLVNSDITYISIDAEKKDSTEIIELLSSNSLFSEKRLLFLKRVYRNKDRERVIPFLIEYLDKNSKDDIVIWEDQKISSVTKYIKYFKSKNLLEEYNKLNKVQFKKYVKQICEEEGLNIDNIIIDLLSEYSNYDTERVGNSIQKLKLLDKQIEKQDIEDLIENTIERDIWRLLDEINKKEGKPLEILENLLKQKIDPLYIIPMISRNLRLIAITKDLLDKNLTTREICSVGKIPPFTVGPLIESANRYDWEKLKSKYQKLSNLDYEIKVGRIEPRLGITLFCTTV